MPLRRILALIVFLASAWIGVQGVRAWQLDRNGIGGGVALLLLGGGALLGLMIAITLAFGGTARRDDPDSGTLSEGARKPLLVTFLLAFCAMFVVIGVRGILRGHMPDIGSRPDIVFAAAPVRFVLLCGFWCGLGALSAWGARWVVRQERQLAAGADDGEGDSAGR